MKNRRGFLMKSALEAGGLTLTSAWVHVAPGIIKYLTVRMQ
ncbi:hypothetical protein [Algoriphagus sp. Y33]|nr:hypothetical protein [Algoriphagus sp. Y33]